MSGPKLDKYSSTSQSSTLDALNQTINSLEEKILYQKNLDKSKNQADPDHFNHSLRDEIRARQRSLSESQDPVMARAPKMDDEFKNISPSSEEMSSSEEISLALAKLRHELKLDMQSTLKQELNHNNEMAEHAFSEDIHLAMPNAAAMPKLSAMPKALDSGVDANIPVNMSRLMEDNLVQINRSLKNLETSRSMENGPSVSKSELDQLRLEVDNLRLLTDTTAKQDTLVNLENRWDNIEQTLNDFNPHSLYAELSDLATRLEDIRLMLATIPQSETDTKPFEEKIDLIARAVADLLDRSGRGENNGQFLELTDQIKTWLAHMADQIETLARHNKQELADRIETISTHLNAFTSETNFKGIEARVAELQASLENDQSAQYLPQLNDQLLLLANKIDNLDIRAASVGGADIEKLVIQLVEIAQRLDERAAAPVSVPPAEIIGIDRLEHQISHIAERLDQTADNHSQVDMNSLQEQISQLSELINHTNLEDVNKKLVSFEEYFNTNDEFVLEAARQAAETALEAYHHNVAGASPSDQQADHTILSSLTADMVELGKMYRTSDERSTKAFEAVQETLLKIANRLEYLNATVTSQSEIQASKPASRQDENAAPQPKVNEAAGVMPNSDGLLSGLANQIKPERQAVKNTDETQAGTLQHPSSEALEEIERTFSDQPLEPGSGAPDINSIMQKVRDVQKQYAMRPQTNNPDQAHNNASGSPDYIASARQAALAAAAEAGSGKRRGSGDNFKQKPGGVKEKSGPLIRKPFLIIAGVGLLVIIGISLMQNFLAPEQNISEPQISATIPDTDNELTSSLAADETLIENEPDRAENLEPGIMEAGPDGTLNDTFVADTQLMDNEGLNEELALDNIASAPLEEVIPEPDLDQYLGARELSDEMAPEALKQAALEGDAVALYEIGIRYMEGRGTSVKLDQAIKWLTLSADLDFAPAQYLLGNFYEKGTEVGQDLEQAKILYEAAANNGNVNAMHNLGVFYASYNGADDFGMAAEWFLQAAQRGVRDSQVNIAILYARGEGVERDLVESYKWFAIAAIGGDKDAAIKRDEVINALTSDSVDLAKAKVENWTATPLDMNANNVQIPDAWIGKPTNAASIDMKKAIRNIQTILNNSGFNAGEPDGVIGVKTTQAIKAFQTSIGLKADGQITDQLVRELLKRNG